MKFLLKSLTILFLIATCTSAAEAQIFKKLKDKAKDALEEKAEQKIDEEIQKAADRMVEDSWDSVFGAAGENGQPGADLPFSLNNDVTTEDVYKFDVITTMKINTERADGESEAPLYMDMHFNEDAQYTGTKFRGGEMDKNKGNFFIIYDLKNSAMVMLMENEDEKFSFAYDWKQAMAAGKEFAEQTEQYDESETAEAEEAPENVNWDEVDEWQGYKKIGSRSIAGYSCDGYRTENEGGTIEVWVTREASFGMQGMFQAHGNAKQLKGKIPNNYPYGMMMEMTSTNTEGDKTVMQIIDVRENADVNYAMTDYPAMNLGKKEK